MNEIIKIKGLRKRFGDNEVLKGITTSVKQGEVVAIIGPSGCGKSTFLRSINLLEEPTEGKILIDGIDLTSWDVDINKMRQRVGMVFQQFNLFPNMTIRRNIMLAPVELGKMTREEADEKATELLSRIGLLDKADSYPDSLSGGQKQRVAIVRALAMNPEVLLFDEPTSALDLRHQLIVMQAARSYAKTTGAAVLAIVHDLMLAARFSDKLLMLGDGTIRRFAAPAEVLTPEELAVVYRVEAAVERSQEGLLTVIPMTPLDVDDGTHGHGSHPHAHDPACTHSSSSDQHDHRIRHDDDHPHL